MKRALKMKKIKFPARGRYLSKCPGSRTRYKWVPCLALEQAPCEYHDERYDGTNPCGELRFWQKTRKNKELECNRMRYEVEYTEYSTTRSTSTTSVCCCAFQFKHIPKGMGGKFGIERHHKHRDRRPVKVSSEPPVTSSHGQGIGIESR